MSSQVKIIKPKAGIVVSQSELANIKALRHLVATTKAELEAQEGNLIVMIQGGAQVEPGPLSASVRQGMRTSVAWRAVVERLKSYGYAENVLKNTKPTPTKPVLEII